MDRAECRRLLVVCATGAFVLLTSACARDQHADPRSASSPSPAPAREPVEARAHSMPEFREYMVGELPTIGVLSRDPFGTDESETSSRSAPSTGVGEKRFVPVLTGIVVSAGRRVAMFDVGTAAAGETVAGWRVVEIGERSALLEKNQGLLRVSM